MPIARENGFLQSHDSGLGTRLGIESDKLMECISYAKSENIRGVFGTPSFGFHESNLDFLSEMPWIEDIWLWDVDLKCIDGIYQLKNLRFLGVEPKRPPLDFSRIQNLQTAVVTPQKKDSGLEDLAHLETLHVWHFRPKEKSFCSLRLPKSLKELQINWANPESLESLQPLDNLKILELHRCNNVRSVGDLASKYPALERIVIDACGKVAASEAAEAIKLLPNLAHAYVQNTKLA
jgi:hypothetical protein